ncbi:MAG: hypothetical protein EWM50_06395 [Gottschalkiaceae bacterium]|nr:MAG: hypothetical protein EWM50_06395 [Gottschalkiaceae bacterium]
MSTIINENELKQFVIEGKIIQNGNIECAEGIKYDFCLGTQFLKSGFSGARDYTFLFEHNAAVIEPGEVVFVLTREYVDIPLDISVVLHEKRKLSQKGISLLGGRGIDPGYKGYLFFGLYNISSEIFDLKPGRKLVGATFYRLNEDEIVTPVKLPEEWSDFPEELEDFIRKYEPVNPIAINEKLNNIQVKFIKDQNDVLRKIDSLENKIILLDDKVGNRFQNLNDKILDKIEDLGDKIEDIDCRSKKTDEFMKNIRTWAKVIAWIIGIGVTILTGVLTGIFSKLFGI